MRRLPLALLLVAMLLLAPSAKAQEMVYQQGALTVRLTSQPCASEVFAAALKVQGAVSVPKAAQVIMGQRSVPACWALDSDADVAMADQDGDKGFLPLAWFKIEPGV